MKSNDFAVNEALLGIDPWQMLGKYALGKLEGSSFTNNFIQQYKKEIKTHPNLPIDDFLEMYWRKNNIDISTLPPTYKQSLDNAKQAVTTTPTSQTLQQLGKVVYSIISMTPASQPNATNQTNPQSVKNPAASSSASASSAASSTQQIDPNTNQIISKIRSIKNTPDEIDDLVDIIAIALFKLYKIAPKNYKRIVTSLFNNGGKPSMPSPTDMTVKPQTTTQSTSPQTGSFTSWQNGPTATAQQNNVPTQPKPTRAKKVATTKTTEPTVKPVPLEPEPIVQQPKVEPEKANEPTLPPEVKPEISTEPSLNDKFPEFDSSKYSEPGEISDIPSKPGRNADFTRGGKGVLDPNSTDSMRNISRKALDKRINARNAVQKKITPKIFRAGIPK